MALIQSPKLGLDLKSLIFVHLIGVSVKLLILSVDSIDCDIEGVDLGDWGMQDIAVIKRVNKATSQRCDPMICVDCAMAKFLLVLSNATRSVVTKGEARMSSRSKFGEASEIRYSSIIALAPEPRALLFLTCYMR